MEDDTAELSHLMSKSINTKTFCSLAPARGLQKHGICCTTFELDLAQGYNSKAQDWISLLHPGNHIWRMIFATWKYWT
jgi:hypothetical protein